MDQKTIAKLLKYFPDCAFLNSKAIVRHTDRNGTGFLNMHDYLIFQGVVLYIFSNFAK